MGADPGLIIISHGPPATDMIRILLTDLQTFDLKAHSSIRSSSRAIIEQLNRIYEGIIGLIAEIDKLETIEWSLFTRWTEGLAKLEALLLSRLLQRQKISPTPPEGPRDLHGHLKSIDNWIIDRRDVPEFAGYLEKYLVETNVITEPGHPATVKNIILKSAQEGDVEAIETIIADLALNSLTDDNLGGELDQRNTYVSDVKREIRTLPALVKRLSANYPQVASAKAVAGVMLLQIPFVVSQQFDLDVRMDEHVKSVELWEAAKLFVQQIKAFLSEERPDQASFDQKYDLFRERLDKVRELTPLTPLVLNLIKTAAHVRRPFHGRSVALVKMWHTLITSRGLDSEYTKDILSGLRYTVASFKMAQTGITSYDKRFSTEIATLNARYGKCFMGMKQLTNTHLSQDAAFALEREYEAAKKLDDEHLEQFKASHRKAGDDEDSRRGSLGVQDSPPQERRRRLRPP